MHGADIIDNASNRDSISLKKSGVIGADPGLYSTARMHDTPPDVSLTIICSNETGSITLRHCVNMDRTYLNRWNPIEN